MSKRRILLLTLPVVVLLAAAATAVWFALPRKNVLTLELTGTSGLPIQGTCEIDGTSQDLTGTVPKQFAFEGYRVTYSLTTNEDSGEFRVRYLVGGVAKGFSGSGNPPKHGVRGWVKSGWGWEEPSHWIEPFDKDGQPEWLSPP